MGDFRSHSGGGGGGEDGVDGLGEVAGFFEELAGCGVGEGFVLEVCFVADEAGGDFDDGISDGDAELFDEDDFLLVCDGEDGHAGGRVGAADVVPAAGAVEAEPFGFVEGDFF